MKLAKKSMVILFVLALVAALFAIASYVFDANSFVAFAAEAGESAAVAEDAAFAAEAAAPSLTAIGAAIAIGFAALGGAIGMGLAIAKAMDGIARQPEASGKIRSVLMLGLVFIETVVIYALIVAILIMFVV